jgi:hypothetical protein
MLAPFATGVANVTVPDDNVEFKPPPTFFRPNVRHENGLLHHMPSFLTRTFNEPDPPIRDFKLDRSNLWKSVDLL